MFKAFFSLILFVTFSTALMADDSFVINQKSVKQLISEKLDTRRIKTSNISKANFKETNLSIKEYIAEKLSSHKLPKIGTIAGFALIEGTLVFKVKDLIHDIKHIDQEGMKLKAAQDASLITAGVAFTGKGISSVLKENTLVVSEIGKSIKGLGISADVLKMTSLTKSLGMIGVAASVVAGTMEVTQIITSDIPRAEKYEKVGGTLGTAAGSAGGLYAGVELGVIIGATMGPIGVAAGGILGGFIGTFSGSKAGEYIGTETGRYLAK